MRDEEGGEGEKAEIKNLSGAALWRNTMAGGDVRTNYWISLVA